MGSSSNNPFNLIGYISLVSVTLLLIWILPRPHHESDDRKYHPLKIVEKKTPNQKIL